jgi:hypothetical protein
MAKLPSAFNAEEHKDMGDFSPVPADTYAATIIDSEYKANSKKTGHLLKLQIRIDGGPMDGRYLWENLNLDNPSKQTVQIAQETLATICRACGLGPIEDSEDLHNIPITIQVAVTPAKGDYPAGNKVNMYSALEGAAKPTNPNKSAGAAGKAEVKPKRKKPVFVD